MTVLEIAGFSVTGLAEVTQRSTGRGHVRLRSCSAMRKGSFVRHRDERTVRHPPYHLKDARTSRGRPAICKWSDCSPGVEGFLQHWNQYTLENEHRTEPENVEEHRLPVWSMRVARFHVGLGTRVPLHLCEASLDAERLAREEAGSARLTPGASEQPLVENCLHLLGIAGGAIPLMGFWAGPADFMILDAADCRSRTVRLFQPLRSFHPSPRPTGQVVRRSAEGARRSSSGLGPSPGRFGMGPAAKTNGETVF